METLVQMNETTLKINGKGHALTWYLALYRLYEKGTEFFLLKELNGKEYECVMCGTTWTRIDKIPKNIPRERVYQSFPALVKWDRFMRK